MAGGGEQSLKTVLAAFQGEVKVSEVRGAPVDTYERGRLRSDFLSCLEALGGDKEHRDPPRVAY